MTVRHEAQVGQIWQDTDKRRCERFVRVLEVQTPEGSTIPLDARIQSCDSKGVCMADCPRMIIALSRLRARFRLILQPDGVLVNDTPPPATPETDTPV